MSDSGGRKKGAIGFKIDEINALYEAIKAVQPVSKADFEGVKNIMHRSEAWPKRSAETYYNKYNRLTLTKQTGAGESENTKQFKQLRQEIEQEPEVIQDECTSDVEPADIIAYHENYTDGIADDSVSSPSSTALLDLRPRKRHKSMTT